MDGVSIEYQWIGLVLSSNAFSGNSFSGQKIIKVQVS